MGEPVQLGPYKLVGRLGAGGMGQVYAGVSPAGRRVAVKVIRPEYASDQRFRDRFTREVEAARRVGGFHTAQVVDADPTGDPPWLATAFVEGPSLARVVADLGALHPSVVRTLGAGLAEGLTAIHACGLVHRDLKPGNIIMAADGPRIIDFGVAQVMDAPSMTATGTPVGTFAFMAPEQANADPAGPPADVFALGCVLAYAATGHSPFEAATVPAIVHRLLNVPPELGRLDPGLRPVVAAFLAKDPAARPTAAQALALLRTPSPRGIPRRGLLLGAAGAAGMAVVLGLPAMLLWPNSGAAAPDQAAAATPSHSPSSGSPVLSGPDSPRALLYDTSGSTLICSADDGSIWRWALPKGNSTGVVHLPVPKLEQPHVFSPDLKLLARAEGNTVKMYETTGGKLVATLSGYPGNVDALAFSPDGKAIAAAGGAQNAVQISDPASGRNITTYHVDIRNGQVSVLAYSPDGHTLVAANNNDTLLLDAATGRTRRTLIGSRAYALAVSADSRTIAVGGTDGNIQIVDSATGQIKATLGHEQQFTGAGMVYSMAFSPDGHSLASANVAPGSATVRLWNLTTSQITRTFAGASYPVAISPDGRTLAAPKYSSGGGIQLWNL